MDTITRAAVTRAADTFTFSRRIQTGPCDYGKSHRDGPCATCVARDEHDAEIARQWHESQA